MISSKRRRDNQTGTQHQAECLSDSAPVTGTSRHTPKRPQPKQSPEHPPALGANPTVNASQDTLQLLATLEGTALRPLPEQQTLLLGREEGLVANMAQVSPSVMIKGSAYRNLILGKRTSIL